LAANGYQCTNLMSGLTQHIVFGKNQVSFHICTSKHIWRF